MKLIEFGMFAGLMLSAQFDVSSEVRRSALQVLRSSSIGMKTSVLIEKAFDFSEIVRAEAFEGLAMIPLSRIRSRQQREKVAYWGLTQTSGE